MTLPSCCCVVVAEITTTSDESRLAMMRKKRRWILASLVLAASLSACGPRTQHGPTLRSPHGAYTVTLTGRQTRTLIPFMSARLRASARGDAGALCSGVFLYQADELDTAFASRFEVSDWPVENALRFKEYLADDDHTQDNLVILNETGRTVPCMRVFTGDLLMVLDAKPGATLKIRVTRGSGGPGSFNAQALDERGAFAESSIPLDRAAYPRDLPLSFTLTISQNGMLLAVTNTIEPARHQ
jgi:hypothetical protein